ncbi:DUF4397 domain-containing protein [Pseudalkalibacillus hwajinpoensis]|uniref:DUF4397 domain-containing protein n=1 Tax=Guptibacillus hwajinpoensis TaxID=208199 RepID=UPI00325AAA9D
MKWIMSVMMIAVLFVTSSPQVFAAQQSNVANVRVVHASPDAPSVDIYVDGKPAFKGASFKDVTDYEGLAPGEKKVQVFPSSANGKGKPVLEQKLTVAAGKDYTVAAIGKLANLSLLALEDQKGSGDNANIRAVHASPDAPPVDIAVKDGDALIKNLAFTQSSDYQEVAPGSYNLEVRPTGSEESVLDLPNLPVEGGVNYTAFAIGFLEGDPALNVILLKDGK